MQLSGVGQGSCYKGVPRVRLIGMGAGRAAGGWTRLHGLWDEKRIQENRTMKFPAEHAWWMPQW